VIVQTAHGGMDNVITAMRTGATDFVVKPVGAERLQVSLRNALAARSLGREIARIKLSRSGTVAFNHIITRNPRMRAALRTAEKAAASAIPVLIEGQSGVGKELIARAIHGSGERRSGPFVAVNCGVVPDDQAEVLLFGDEKGALIDASERSGGKFAEASGGTLFLEEVAELPPSAQSRLLRAVARGEVERVGARKPFKIDARLVCATTRDLIAEVKAGRFREDLLYRLHIHPIAVPTLRERPEDIPQLVHHFLARFAAEEGKHIARVSAEALARLSAYHWPGNVRQLESALFRAVALAQTDTIGVDEFPQIGSHVTDFVPSGSVAPDLAIRAAASAHFPAGDGSMMVSEAGHRRPSPAGAIVAPPSGLIALLDGNGDMRPLEDIEAETIRFALSHYRGQRSEVARRLRIGRSTLYRRLDSLGLDNDPSDTEAPAL
jgi:DNA-binding NtrC family response regulator